MGVGNWEGHLFHTTLANTICTCLFNVPAENVEKKICFHENHIENKQWMQWKSFVRLWLEDSFMPHLPTKDLRDLPPRNDTLTQIWERAKVFNTPLTYPPPFYDLPGIYCSTAPESNFTSFNAVALILALRNGASKDYTELQQFLNTSEHATNMLPVFKCLWLSGRVESKLAQINIRGLSTFYGQSCKL